MIFIYLLSKVTPVSFKTHLALHRCKYQPGKKIVRILTISSLTCLFSLLLYERDGEWKSNVYFPFRIRLLTSVWVLRQIAKFLSGFIKFNTPHTVKPDERICISIYIDFSISRNCRPFSLLVVMVILSLLISAIEIVSLFLFREKILVSCVASHIAGVTLVTIWIREVTLTSVSLQSSAVWGFPFINVIQFLKVTEENYMSNLRKGF